MCVDCRFQEHYWGSRDFSRDWSKVDKEGRRETRSVRVIRTTQESRDVTRGRVDLVRVKSPSPPVPRWSTETSVKGKNPSESHWRVCDSIEGNSRQGDS